MSCFSYFIVLFFAILYQSLSSGLGDIEQSAILGYNPSLKQEYIDTLTSYLSPILQSRYTGWKKCYQATVDDWEPSSFRVKCTYKGPTVTIVRYGNYTLGGYTKLIWKSEYQLLLPLLPLKCMLTHLSQDPKRRSRVRIYWLSRFMQEGRGAYILNQMFLCLFDLFWWKNIWD